MDHLGTGQRRSFCRELYPNIIDIGIPEQVSNLAFHNSHTILLFVLVMSQAKPQNFQDHRTLSNTNTRASKADKTQAQFRYGA